ncbi:putative malate dehydrogenase 1B [Lycorma delicatula]|uniref:putative malate dehydrogenase 1B n=1 Tax=Lycorma delicatula TaxID=130591 RepID=UPI003F50E271
MSIFMVIGKFGCLSFATADYFIRNLTRLVPGVKMKSQSFTSKDYEMLLMKMRSVLKCEHTGSPLIWRDLEQIGLCPSYIGGISELYDFCEEYYNITLPIHCMKENEYIEKEFRMNYLRGSFKKAKEEVAEKGCHICILGAGNPVASLLILELVQDKLLYNEDYLEIRLYDERKDKEDKLKSIVWDIEGVECPNMHKRKVFIPKTLYEAVKGCNILVIMTEVKRKFYETLESWLTRNYQFMRHLAEYIDEIDVASLDVIVTGIELLCFNTAVLLKYSEKLTPCKTIAVSSHLGLEALQYVANVSNIAPNDIFGSPVWGYIGINHIVDICHTKCLYRRWEIRRRPRKFPLKIHQPPIIRFTEQPNIIIEKRDICFRTHMCELMWQWISNQKQLWLYYDYYMMNINDLLCQEIVKSTHGHFPCMSQVKSSVHVINMWINSEYSKEIISAGIRSNGSYDIPEGIVFSQPVILKDGKWQICTKFPVPHCIIKLRNLFFLPTIISQKFGLVDGLPSFEKGSLLPIVTDEDKLTIIERQRKIRAKRSVLLDCATFSDEYSKGSEDSKRLEKKNKMIEQIKELRNKMKETAECNQYSWYYKRLNKIKKEQDNGDEKTETDAKTASAIPEQVEVEEEKEDLFEVTWEEICEKVDSLDLINELGPIYGNKILSKYEKKEPLTQTKKVLLKKNERYKIC